MSQHSSGYRLQVDANIEVEIDNQPATLLGQGNQLQLTVKNEETLDTLAGGDRFMAGKLANTLAATGLALTVSDKQGPVVILGSGVSSRASNWITGSRHIAPVSTAALLKLVRHYLVGRIRTSLR